MATKAVSRTSGPILANPPGEPSGAANVGAVLGDAKFVANYQVPET